MLLVMEAIIPGVVESKQNETINSETGNSGTSNSSENDKSYYVDYFDFSSFYPFFQPAHITNYYGFSPFLCPQITFSDIAGQYPLYRPYWKSHNDIFHIWLALFQKFFSQYLIHQNNLWSLIQTTSTQRKDMQTFTDSAKVRFHCKSCNHGWTSMKGRVGFWFHLDRENSSGVIYFKLYGQQCIKCVKSEFQSAMWYPEEIIKVLGNIYNRVGQEYYGFQSVHMRVDRRIGKPMKSHNHLLCQACHDGICKEWNSGKEFSSEDSLNEDIKDDSTKKICQKKKLKEPKIQ